MRTSHRRIALLAAVAGALLWLLAPPASAQDGAHGPAIADIVVTPSGSDSGAGTLDDPFATLGKAVSVVRPGQTITLLAGTYLMPAPVTIRTSGTADARITLTTFGRGRAVLDGSGLSSSVWPVSVQASFWTVQNLEIVNANNHPLVCTSCTSDVFRNLSVHDNQETGIALRGDNTVDNQILDSDFFRNHDDATNGQNADGIAIKFGSGTGNVVSGCRMFDNTDDGIDLWEFTSPVTIQNSWSYDNGVNLFDIPDFQGNGNGFKLGGGSPTVPPVAHIATNDAAWDNAANGFTENSNGGTISVSRDTAFANGATGFFFSVSSSTLTANLALSDKRDKALGSAVTATDNSWQGTGWDTSALESTDPSTATGPRNADGTLPATTFLVDLKDPAIGATMTE